MGDMLFFPALTIHKALPNITEDKMRLSLDNRYFAVGDPIPDHMQEPHPPSGLNWEQVCANWSSDEFKYFWKDFDFPTVPRDLSFSENSFAEALELAKEGDERAFLQLRRKIFQSPRFSGSRSCQGRPCRGWRAGLTDPFLSYLGHEVIS